MIDGLYRVAFQTPLGAGAGVVHLSGGKIWGGDSVLYYFGSYIQSGEIVSANVSTNRHTTGDQSVFGIDRVNIRLSGKIRGNAIEMSGSAIEASGIVFQAILTKLVN